LIEKFRFYLENGFVRKISPNAETAFALMNRAYARFDYVKGQKIEAGSAPFIFEDIYEALREATQSLMELKGYKPHSHEAQVSFLREFFSFPEHALFTLDRLRILRNKCVYGAVQISPETCREALAFAAAFLPALKKEFDKE
jgi:hypothetical protein